MRRTKRHEGGLRPRPSRCGGRRARARGAVEGLAAAVVAACICASVGTPAAQADDAYRIAYDGSSLSLDAADANLFARFGAILPGETRSERVVLENASGAPCDFYLRADGASASRPDASDAPGRIALSIEADGETVYEGSLSAELLWEGVPLGRVEADGDIEVAFSVTADPTLGNAVALSSVSAPWTFAVQQVPGEGKSASLASTGDAGAAIAAAAFIAAGAAAAGVACIARGFAKGDAPAIERGE